MEYELLNELVYNGYEAEDLDSLYEFAMDFILEYETLIEEEDYKYDPNDKKRNRKIFMKGVLWSPLHPDVMKHHQKKAEYYRKKREEMRNQK